MVWRTHVLFGLSSIWLVSWIPALWNPGTAAPMAVCAAVGALLPDLDAGTAKIAQLSVARIRPLAPLSIWVGDLFGHRGVTHSVLGLVSFGVISALLAALWFGPPGAAAALLGYASHLAGDACTVSGIPFLFPDRTRRFLLPKLLRFATGSHTEDLLLLLFAEASLALLLPVLLNR